MKLQDLLIFCMAHGIELRLIGNKIHYYKPDGNVPAVIIFFIRHYKKELLKKMAEVKLPPFKLVIKLMDEEEELLLSRAAKEKSENEDIPWAVARKILFEKKMWGR